MLKQLESGQHISCMCMQCRNIAKIRGYKLACEYGICEHQSLATKVVDK